MMADPPSSDDLKLPTFADDVDKAGITSTYLIKKLKRELNAKETKFFQHEGRVVESENVIAWGIRQRARQDAHKLRGDYPAEKVEHDVGIIVNIEATPIKKKKRHKEV